MYYDCLPDLLLDEYEVHPLPKKKRNEGDPYRIKALSKSGWDWWAYAIDEKGREGILVFQNSVMDFRLMG